MYDDKPVGSWRDNVLDTAPRPRETVGPKATPAVPRPSNPSTTRRPTGRPVSSGPVCSLICLLLRGRKVCGSTSPASQVHRPLVDDRVTVDDEHALMKGDGRVDVGGQHANPVAQRHVAELLRLPGGVLVGAEPDGAARNGRVAVIHSQRLQAYVDHRPAWDARRGGCCGDDGSEDGQRVPEG